jgi:hypothetical protein
MDEDTVTNKNESTEQQQSSTGKRSRLEYRVASPETISRERNPIKRFIKILGPGLITGAADDDPSGIATYSISGASLGFATLWTALVTLPLMAVIQFLCAKIGLVAGIGLAGVLGNYYSRWLLYPAVLSLDANKLCRNKSDICAILDSCDQRSGFAATISNHHAGLEQQKSHGRQGEWRGREHIGVGCGSANVRSCHRHARDFVVSKRVDSHRPNGDRLGHVTAWVFS